MGSDRNNAKADNAKNITINNAILEMDLLSRVYFVPVLNKVPYRTTPKKSTENSTARIFVLKARPNKTALEIKYLIFR